MMKMTTKTEMRVSLVGLGLLCCHCLAQSWNCCSTVLLGEESVEGVVDFEFFEHGAEAGK